MNILLMTIGGLLYCLFEIIWRGHTHWTMFLLGGVCFLIMGLLNEYRFEWRESLLMQSVVSAVIITIFELVTGVIVNIVLDWNVWDYSDVPFNLWGQICLPYFFIWIALSAFGIFLDDWIRYGIYVLFGNKFQMQKREKPHYFII